MSRDDYIRRLSGMLPVALVIAVLLRILLGAQSFSIFGVAAVALLTLPLVARMLSLRLPTVGLSSRRMLLYAVPVGLLAGGHILYWLTFFSGNRVAAVMLGSIRNMIQTNAAFAWPLLYGLVAAMAIWPLASAAQNAGLDRRS